VVPRKPAGTIRTSERGFLPGLKGARLFANLGEDQQISEEMVIRILYGSLEETTAASGKPVTFELSGFSTLYPADFSGVHWPELVTQQGGGRRIKIERVETRAGRNPVGITYEPSWTSDSEPSAELRAHLDSRNVSQLLAELAPQEKNLSGVLAVTRYQVTVSLEGVSRAYNAAVLWLDPDRDGVATLAVQDNITDRVDEAVTERLNAGPRASFEQQVLAGTVGGGASPSFFEKAGSCTPHELTYSLPQLKGPDGQGHVTGYHGSGAKFNFRCTCDSTCRSSCWPTLTNTSCFEMGSLASQPRGTHRTRTLSWTAGGSKANTDFVGADCGAGWACYIQFCPDNVCASFQIVPTANPITMGVRLTFQATGPYVWDGTLDQPFQCDGCAAGEPGDAGGPTGPPPIENPDPNPGGGSGGGGAIPPGCGWRCEIRPSENGEYREECWVTC
jgi:hypothetical protein